MPARLSGALALCALTLSAERSLRAEDFLWTGAVNTSFHDPANWSSPARGVPGEHDRAIFAPRGMTEMVVNTGFFDGRVGQLRFESGESNVRLIGLSSPLRCLGDGPLIPAIEIVTPPDASETRARLQNFGALGNDVYDAESVVLTTETPDAAGSAVLEVFGLSPDRTAELRVTELVRIGDGALAAEVIVGPHARLDANDVVLASGDPRAHGALRLLDVDGIVEGVLRVGMRGTAEVELSGDGELTCDELLVGVEMNAVGTVIISGDDAECFVHAACDLGYAGAAHVEVRDGARFTSFSPVMVGFLATILPDFTIVPSHGVVAVIGTDSEFLALDDLWIGFAGNGTLRSVDGGRYRLNGDVRTGNGAATHIDVVLGAATGRTALVDVDGDVDSLRYAIGLDGERTYDGSETWTVIAADSVAEPLEIVIDSDHPEWRALATWDTERITVTLVPRADLDGSGTVDFNDLLLVLAAWGPCPEGPCLADLDQNGTVDFDDLLRVLARWSMT